MARPKLEKTRKFIGIRIDPIVYNSIVSYQNDRDVETFTKAVEDILTYGILHYYTTNTTYEPWMLS